MDTSNADIPPNPLDTEDDKAIVKQLTDWSMQAGEGALISDLMRHPGFKPFKAWLDGKSTDAKNDFALAKTPQETWDVKQKMVVYQDVANYFNSRVSKGNAANKATESYYKEQEDLKKGFNLYSE